MQQRLSTSPQSDIQIMDAQPAHFDAVRAHSDATHRTHRASLPHVFAPDNAYQHALLDAASAPAPARHPEFCALVRVACRDGVLLGYVLVIWNPAKEHAAGASALIADIGTLEAGRAQGIGAALLADIKGQMHTRGWQSLEADVWQQNTASHKIFAGAGFDGERTLYRFGTPPPLTENAPHEAARNSVWLWLLVLGAGGAVLAFLGR